MPHSLPWLQDLLVLLLASVPIAFIFNRLRLPTIVGFMITGVWIGPYGLGLIKDVGAIKVLAEIGVVLLLFTIGLEFSLRRILEMKRLVLLGGGLQVTLTVLLRYCNRSPARASCQPCDVLRLSICPLRYCHCTQELYRSRGN